LTAVAGGCGPWGIRFGRTGVGNDGMKRLGLRGVCDVEAPGRQGHPMSLAMANAADTASPPDQ